MAYTYTRQLQLVKTSTSVLISKAYSADAVQSMELSISTGVTDQQVDLAVTLARLKWIIITSNVALGVESFDSSSAGNTWTLAADSPLQWFHDDPVANPLDDGVLTKITKLLLTNASGSTATVKIEVGYDPTP
jgi:hypothetical protein